VTFLALLELIRLKQLIAVQPEVFGEIEICRAAPQAIEPPQQPAGEPPETPPAAGAEAAISN
jgi:chromatin segregation and condensation protein Rec8/ScpA/Scc1 (kleisin family)